MTINEYQALAMRTLNQLKKRYPEGFDTERSTVRPEGDL